MTNNLYRIEVIAHDNLPQIDTAGMLMTNEGIAYVKLHPVRIKPKKEKEAKLYWKADGPGRWTLTCNACDLPATGGEDAKYCSKCGAKFVKPKAERPVELEEGEEDG